jgi:hypothetical protein
MSTRRLVIAGALALGLSAAAVHAGEPAAGSAAQASLEVLVDTIRANRKAFVAVNLQLDSALT